jgi:hypothetical protein
MGSSLSNNNISHYSVVRSMNFSVTRHTLIDLRDASASTSNGTTFCTSYMGSVVAKIFFCVSWISSSCTLLPLTPRETLSPRRHHCEWQTLCLLLYYKNNIIWFPSDTPQRNICMILEWACLTSNVWHKHHIPKLWGKKMRDVSQSIYHMVSSQQT